MLSQYWLGGSPENVESLLLTLAKAYVPAVTSMESVSAKDISEPVLLPDKGIWHPVADKVFENPTEYLTWYNTVSESFACMSVRTSYKNVESKFPAPTSFVVFDCWNEAQVRFISCVRWLVRGMSGSPITRECTFTFAVPVRLPCVIAFTRKSLEVKRFGLFVWLSCPCSRRRSTFLPRASRTTLPWSAWFCRRATLTPKTSATTSLSSLSSRLAVPRCGEELVTVPDFYYMVTICLGFFKLYSCRVIQTAPFLVCHEIPQMAVEYFASLARGKLIL